MTGPSAEIKFNLRTIFVATQPIILNGQFNLTTFTWSNLDHDSMSADDGIERTVSDESCVLRFNFSAGLDSKGGDRCTHFLLVGFGNRHFVDNMSWQGRQDLGGCRL